MVAICIGGSLFSVFLQRDRRIKHHDKVNVASLERAAAVVYTIAGLALLIPAVFPDTLEFVFSSFIVSDALMYFLPL